MWQQASYFKYMPGEYRTFRGKCLNHPEIQVLLELCLVRRILLHKTVISKYFSGWRHVPQVPSKMPGHRQDLQSERRRKFSERNSRQYIFKYRIVSMVHATDGMCYCSLQFTYSLSNTHQQASGYCGNNNWHPDCRFHGMDQDRAGCTSSTHQSFMRFATHVYRFVFGFL